MGLFDEIYIDKRVVEVENVRCLSCDKLMINEIFQTKDFENAMLHYYLAYDEENKIRLYKLDPPHDERFWHTYTKGEIQDLRNRLEEFYWHQNGYWKKEAYLPQNRRQRFMGELPHQWVKIYTMCDCDGCANDLTSTARYVMLDLEIKFTDGIVEEIKKKERQ